MDQPVTPPEKTPPDIASPRIEQIAEATRQLFLRYGYRRTSVDDIAREAGVAKATLYLHFAGKEEMFRAMIARFRAVMNQRCDAAEALAAPLRERLAALLYAHYGTVLEWFGDASHINEIKDFVAEYPLEPLDEEEAPTISRRLRQMLTTAHEAGEIDPAQVGLAIDDVVRTIRYAAHGAKLAQRTGATTLRPALEAIVALTIGSLSPAAARRPRGAQPNL